MDAIERNYKEDENQLVRDYGSSEGKKHETNIMTFD